MPSLPQPAHPAPSPVRPPAGTRIIAGALEVRADEGRHGTGQAGPAGRSAPPRGPALTDDILGWLASWHPGPVHRYDADNPVIEELAHDRWLGQWFDANDDRSTAPSPGRLAATRLLSALPDTAARGLLWLVEPTHLHVSTDHLILLHGAGDDLDEADADALVQAAKPVFDDAGLGLERLDARHWVAWPLDPDSPPTSASVPAARSDPAAPPSASPAPLQSSRADSRDQPPARSPDQAREPRPASPSRISVKVVGQRRDQPPARPERPDATATAASAAAAQGYSIDHYLPRGQAGRTLRRLANTVQMAWHEHPVNEARLERGLPILNSLWFTGPTTAADVTKLRARMSAEHVTIDDGPLLAGLRNDRDAWQQQLAAALARAAADPDLQRLVLCGERGAREFVRKPSASARPGGAGGAARPGGAGSPGDPGKTRTTAGTGLSGRLRALGRRLAGLAGLSDAPPATDPSTWFVEPASPDPKHRR